MMNQFSVCEAIRENINLGKTPRKYTITVTVAAVPHPNTQKAIDLIANLVLKNFSEELEQAKLKQPISEVTR